MAKYQKYSEYKDSGVEWLGTIPNHWSLKKHKYIAVFSKGKNPELLFDNYSDGLYPYLSMDSLRGKVESKYAEYKKGLVLVQDNQPLIIWDGSNSGEFVLGKKGLLSSTMASASLIYKIQDKYYWYLCVCIEPEMRKYATGMGIPHVNGEELRGILLPLPDLNEQAQIANFLDHETAKIDTLIAKQEKLIELLKEKRQAVISHAVTKGLNPDVKMKDSGVEWLGEVPEHWTVSKLKHFVNVVDCKHITAEFFDEGIPLASIGEVKGWKVNLSKAKLTNEKYYFELIDGNRKPQIGDIIYTRNATVGEAALVHEELSRFALGQDVCLIHIIQKLYPEFLLHFLKSEIIKIQLNSAMVGSTFKRINVDDIRNYLVVIPPFDEQKEILKSLEINTKQYDSLISSAEKQINLMKERRTALISSAVTGKINVSNWQHPNEAKTELSL